jgi:hypothetical protein
MNEPACPVAVLVPVAVTDDVAGPMTVVSKKLPTAVD